MAARRSVFYTTETVMKFWNSDAVEEGSCSDLDETYMDNNSSADIEDIPEEIGFTSKFSEERNDSILSCTEKEPLHDESILVRSDILFASSDEEDNDSDSLGEDVQLENLEDPAEHSEEEPQDLNDGEPQHFDDKDLHHSNDEEPRHLNDEEPQHSNGEDQHPADTPVREALTDTDSSEQHTDSASEDNMGISSVGRGRRRGRGRDRGRGRGRGRPRGRALFSQGRGHPSSNSRGRGRGATERGRSGRRTPYRDLIPPEATPITVPDDSRSAPPDFNPLRIPGPHLPPGENPTSELDYFRLFFDDEILDNLVVATNDYAEDKKDQVKSMYKRFKLKELTRDEMLAFIGVLIHLGINTVRNYKQVGNIRSSQVSKR